MLKPYVYISTGKSKDIQRDAPEGARAAVHYPEFGRTIELQTDANGHWVLTDRPAPGHDGNVLKLAEGRIINFVNES
jgi:hypothetical protein